MPPVSHPFSKGLLVVLMNYNDHAPPHVLDPMKWDSWRSFADEPTHWQNSVEKGLLKAEYLGDYRLRLWFEEELDVSIYDLDFYPLLLEEAPGPALKPLNQIERFQFVKGDYALIWPNPETGAYDETAIDLALECVRFLCEHYGRLVKPGPTAINGGVPRPPRF